MADNRLLEALQELTPEEAERFFANESRLQPPDPAVVLAPVRRIALFAEAFLPKVDGVSKTAFLTLRYLQRTGREVLVFAPDIAPPAIGGTRIIRLPSLGASIAPESRLALPHPVIWRELDAFQPDLIHVFSPALAASSAISFARSNAIPVIANFQTDLPAYAPYYGAPAVVPLVRAWLRYWHRQCTLTLAPSRYTSRQLQAEGYRRLRRWGRGVNSTHFHPQRRNSRMRERLLDGRDPDALLYLYVGRLSAEKRVDLLLDLAHLPGIALTIVGDGPQRAELEAQFAGTSARFTGYLFGDDLAEAYASADAFVFPGVTETFGQVVQEALASGLPVLTVNQGGVVDLVRDGETGFVLEPDSAAFARAAAQLRDQPALRQHMGHAARASAEANPWEKVLEQLEVYYHEAITLTARYNRCFPPAPAGVQGLLERLKPAKEAYDRVS
ncbi:MAG TPA: glycosyltransferase family 1 protein [Candidatus Limnocylindrales bacterium]|nr:glycosyltransferase family 1 protein [Candidatus Limnocylindrales bacterium]